MTLAQAILADLLADESEWWAGELQTVTGYFFSEYCGLVERMKQPDFEWSSSDLDLLYGAASGLAYCEPPYLEALNVKSMFGDDWVTAIDEFIEIMKRRK